MKFIKSIFLTMKIRALEAFAQGQQDTLALVADQETRHRMTIAHMNTINEITRLKAEYRRAARGYGIRAIVNI